jgi:hypothetical protein
LEDSAVAVEHHNSLRQPANLSAKFDLIASLESAIYGDPGMCRIGIVF